MYVHIRPKERLLVPAQGKLIVLPGKAEGNYYGCVRSLSTKQGPYDLCSLIKRLNGVGQRHKIIE